MEPREFYVYYERYKNVRKDLNRNLEAIQRIEEAIEAPEKREGLTLDYLNDKLKEAKKVQESILLRLNQLETKKIK